MAGEEPSSAASSSVPSTRGRVDRFVVDPGDGMSISVSPAVPAFVAGMMANAATPLNRSGRANRNITKSPRLRDSSRKPAIEKPADVPRPSRANDPSSWD
jgi:hypothetical protein